MNEVEECSINADSSSSRKFCAVPKCRKRGGRMFCFPKDTKRREKWRLTCRITRRISDSMTVCGQHFASCDLYETSKGRVRVKKTALPTKCIPLEDHSGPPAHKRCVVPGCDSFANGIVSTHHFPRDQRQRIKWKNICQLKKLPTRESLICSGHFNDDDFRVTDNKKILKSSSVPSCRLPTGDKYQPNSESGEEDTENEHCGASSKSSLTALKNGVNEVNSDEISGKSADQCQFSDENPTSNICGVAENRDEMMLSEIKSEFKEESENVLCEDHMHAVVDNDINASQSNFSGSSCSNIYNSTNTFQGSTHIAAFQFTEISGHSSLDSTVKSLGINDDSNTKRCLRESITDLFQSNSSCQTDHWTILEMIKNDTQLKTFTGITFSMLDTLEKLVKSLLHGHGRMTLPLRERIVLTLCKLRMNASYKMLSVFFGVDQRLCSLYFKRTLPLLAAVLKGAIYWPTVDENRLNMPKYYSKYKDTRVVLDCIEIAVDSPDCITCRLKLYSPYKKGLTVKFLVGVAPAGLITYISKAYGGKVSDDYIFEQSDLNVKDMLDPLSDAIMVDKGSQVDKICEDKYIKNIRSPFVRQRRLLSENEAVENAEIASSRAHVERSIQRLAIFSILRYKVEWNMLSFIDDIMTVIVGITNMSEPILANRRPLSKGF